MGSGAAGERAAETGELPPAHGYYREHMFMGAREKAELRRSLEHCAADHGFRLDKVFEERLETFPEGFRALVDAAITDHAAVIVPSPVHLAAHGNPVTLRSLLAGAIDRPVLVCDPSSRQEPIAVMGRLHRDSGAGQ